MIFFFTFLLFFTTEGGKRSAERSMWSRYNIIRNKNVLLCFVTFFICVFQTGIHPIFNGSLPVNQRVKSVSIRCIDCPVPRYQPLELNKYYRMIAPSFIANGGDGFHVSNYKVRTISRGQSVRFFLILNAQTLKNL